MITFRNVVGFFETIAEKHLQINSFHSGFMDEVDINKLDQSDFPILYCEPGTATIDMGVLTYSFTIFVLDMLKEDLTNRDIVWTSTLQTTQDVVAEFRQNLALQTSGGDSGKKFSYVPDEAVLELPLSTEPFTARFANILTGWSTSMSIQVNNANNLCDAPIEPSDNAPNT